MGFSVEVVGIEKFGAAVQQMIRATNPPQLTKALEGGARIVQQQAQKNAKSQGLYDTGNLHDSIQVSVVSPRDVQVAVGAEYGAVHEFGYTGTITAKQRKFFWAKYIETGDNMWKALALSTSYTIPARPYVRPAVDEKGWEAKLWVINVLRRAITLGAKFR